jgi:hypothetical protein
MTISMYSASIPVFIRQLKSLSHLLSKGEESANERGIDPSVFVNARLAPDMLPLKNQIYIATDISKFFAVRLGGAEAPKFPDTESTFAELHDRIQHTIAFFQSITPEQINGTEEKPVTISSKVRGDMHFNGLDYLTGFVLPNLYFHCTTAYAILRHNGVMLGKADFFAQPETTSKAA